MARSTYHLALHIHSRAVWSEKRLIAIWVVGTDGKNAGALSTMVPAMNLTSLVHFSIQ